jgi:hypothetical protein
MEFLYKKETEENTKKILWGQKLFCKEKIACFMQTLQNTIQEINLISI